MSRLNQITCAWVLMAVVGVLPAQETRGSIDGRVLDPTSAAVAGAKVVVTNKATNVSVEAQANEMGSYHIPFLNPGVYRMVAEKTGFKTFVRDNVEIRVHDRVRVDITLELGQVTETVEVTAQTPLLETADANRGQVIDRRRISELPIPHGSFPSLIWLASNQARGTSDGTFKETQPSQNWGPSDVSVDGAPVGTMDWTLDGVPNTQTSETRAGRGFAISPPADMIQEFKIETNYDASFGFTSGAVISLSLKSGTNRLHGTAYGFWRNSALNANGFTANLTGEPKRTFVYGRWGTTASGPLYIPKVYDGTNRTFFSYGYEGLHQSLPEQYVGTVPTVPQRGGDFSALLALGSAYQVYDPLTTKAAPDGRFARDPFPGNILPSFRLNPIAQNYLKYLPEPNGVGTARGENNYTQSQSPDWQKYFSHLLRIDHTINPKNRFYARGAVSRKFDGPYFIYFGPVTSGGNNIARGRNFVLDEVYTPTPAIVINARYGYSRYDGRESPSEFDLAQLGFSKSFLNLLDPRANWFPAFSVAGYTMPSKVGRAVQIDEVHSLVLDMNWYKWHHNVKFGANLRANRGAVGLYDGILPRFSFDSSYTNGPSDSSPAAPIGQGLAALLLGQPSDGSITRVDDQAIQSPYWGFYVHDDWRASQKLTLNLGVRWEYEGPLTERFNRSVRSFDSTTANPVDAAARAAYAANPISEIAAAQFGAKGGLLFAALGGQPRGVWDPDKNNFSPRFGFAYQATRKTAIRGGYGVYFLQLGQAAKTRANQIGYSQVTSVVPTLDNGQTFRANLNNPFPDGVLSPPKSSLGFLTYVGRSINAFDPKICSPYVQRWSFGVQNLLPGSFLLDVSYIGNRGTKLVMNRDYSAVPNQYLSTSPVRDQATINHLSQAVPNPFAGLLPGTTLNGTAVARSQLLRPYPEFLSVVIPTNRGYSWYHSLQLRSERRFANGFSALVSYTWSKTMQATELLNAADPLPYRVISDRDRTHALSFSSIWELPFGEGRRFLSAGFPVVRQLFGGWQVGTIWLAMSGTPLGFGNAIFVGNLKDIPLPESQRTYDRAFNTDAGFERVPGKALASNLRTFPIRFSGIRSDGFTSWDFSLIKQVPVSERIKIQLRGEFLNAFNHPNFRPSNTTPTSSAFGRVAGDYTFPRQIQLGLKLLF